MLNYITTFFLNNAMNFIIMVDCTIIHHNNTSWARIRGQLWSLQIALNKARKS